MSYFTQKNAVALKSFQKLSQALGSRGDYVQGGGGNTSVKIDKQFMAIKASGFLLRDMTPEAGYAVVDAASLRTFFEESDTAKLPDIECEGSRQIRQAVIVPDGLTALRPSVESGFHALLKRFVAHSHSVYANIINCMHDGYTLFQLQFPELASESMFVPYAHPGSCLTFQLVQLEKRKTNSFDGSYPHFIFLQNHGLIVHADNVEDCIGLHEKLNRALKDAFCPDDVYPQAQLKPYNDHEWQSATPWLESFWERDVLNCDYFHEHVLYPDQLVYLNQLMLPSTPILPEGHFCFDTHVKTIRYRMKPTLALAIEETLIACLFVLRQLDKAHAQPTLMHQQARSFIESWESEKHRQKALK